MRFPELQQVAGLGDVLGGGAPMHIVAGVAVAKACQFPDQRHQRVGGAGKALGEALTVEQLEIAFTDNFVGRGRWNHPKFRLRLGQCRLDVEPSLPARVLGEQYRHTGVGDPQRCWVALLHGVVFRP